MAIATHGAVVAEPSCKDRADSLCAGGLNGLDWKTEHTEIPWFTIFSMLSCIHFEVCAIFRHPQTHGWIQESVTLRMRLEISNAYPIWNDQASSTGWVNDFDELHHDDLYPWQTGKCWAIGAPFLGTGASLAERPLYTPTLERRWPTCNQKRTQEDWTTVGWFWMTDVFKKMLNNKIHQNGLFNYVGKPMHVLNSFQCSEKLSWKHQVNSGILLRALIGVDVSAAILEHSEFSWGRWVSTMKRLSKAEQQIWRHFAFQTPTIARKHLGLSEQKHSRFTNRNRTFMPNNVSLTMTSLWLCRQNTWTLQVSGSSLIRVSQEPTFLPLTRLPRKHMMSSVNSKNCASGRFPLFKD